jgi:hypothetical protein
VVKTDDPSIVISAYNFGEYVIGKEYEAELIEKCPNIPPSIEEAGFHIFSTMRACKEFLSVDYWGPEIPPTKGARICRCHVRGPVGAGVIPESIQGSGRRIMKYKYRTLLEVVE